MPPDLVIDMRCLQDAGHAERGIPSHAGTLLRLAKLSPWASAARITGIIDPALPPPGSDLAALVTTLRPNAYLPQLAAGSVFLNLSPMGPDQEVLGRLLFDARIRTAAAVYDFIPLQQPVHYLADAPARLAYSTALTWLRHYELFLPISAATEAKLIELVGARRSVVTGVPLSLFGGADNGPPATPAHLLMVGGDDARKNPELPVRAHAGSAVLQASRIPLLITGNYKPARVAALRTLAAEAGGDPALLHLPGRISAAALRDAYRAAYAVITPSYAEGFSLPVVEAMAAGVPSLASDIPAHAALLADPAWRFEPDNVPALKARLEPLVTDRAARAATVAAQAGIWPQFRAEAVARRFWTAVAELGDLPAPAVTAGRRPRLALVAPLPPVRSGVADYSAGLAAALRQHAELSLFAPTPAPGAVLLSGLPHLSTKFDRVVATLGNAAHYDQIYHLLLRYGGACICHDARLLGFALTRFGPAGAAAMASRELGRIVTAAEADGWGQDETRRQANLLGEVAAAARPLFFHDRHTVAEVGARFGVTARHLPFAIYRPWPDARFSPADQAEARARLGLPAGETIIASFGFVEPSKGVEPALRALALLDQAGARCRLLWIGTAGDNLGRFQALAASLGVAALSHFSTAYLDEASYRDHLLAADIGLQLRVGQRGNISGALQDCIAAGLPSVANADLAENLDAPAYISRVPDALPPAAIAAALTELIQARRPRDHFGQMRRDYCDRHGMDRYAESLCTLLEL